MYFAFYQALLHRNKIYKNGKDVEATVKQILELEKAGCEIVRSTCMDMEDANAIKEMGE